MLPVLRERFLAFMKRLKQLMSSTLPGDDRDTDAWRPVARKPTPNPQRGAVAVAEPDE